MPSRFIVPPSSCDAHIHIYDDRFPTQPPGAAIVQHATVAEYKKVQQRLGTARVVIVTPGGYRTDNRVTLDAIEQLGVDRARGVAVLHPDVDDSTLNQLHEGGVRGLRFTLFNPATSVTSVDMIEPLAQRIHRLGWHVQLHMLPTQIVQNRELIDRLPGTIVFDHFARLLPVDDATQEACTAVSRWLADGRAWIKFSAPYLTRTASDPAAIQDLASHFLGVAPDRIVWGSDWPHPTEQPDNVPDDEQLLACLAQWAPSEAQRHRILVDNPASLYGFGQ